MSERAQYPTQLAVDVIMAWMGELPPTPGEAEARALIRRMNEVGLVTFMRSQLDAYIDDVTAKRMAERPV